MTTLSFRILAGLLFLVITYTLNEIDFLTTGMPDMAVAYIQWWQAQPLNSLQELVLRYGELTHAVLLLSIVGVGFLWSPARYAFAFTILLMVLREAIWPIPLLVLGRHIVLDNLVGIMSGMLIVAMFSAPLRHQFVNNPFKRGKPA